MRSRALAIFGGPIYKANLQLLTKLFFQRNDLWVCRLTVVPIESLLGGIAAGEVDIQRIKYPERVYIISPT